MTEQTATGIDLVWAALIERAQTMHPDASKLACDVYQYGVSSGIERMQPEVERLSHRVAEQDALLTQAYAHNTEQTEELVQLDAALEKAEAERDRLAEVSGRVLDLTTTALRYGTDCDRQIKAAVGRGDSAEELFYAGAYRALQAVRDLIRGGHALTWDGTPHSTSRTETAATSTDPQRPDEPAPTAN